MSHLDSDEVSQFLPAVYQHYGDCFDGGMVSIKKYYILQSKNWTVWNNLILVVCRTETVSLAKLAAACLVVHEICAMDGNGPALVPYSVHLWIAYGGLDFLATLNATEGLPLERTGYLSMLYQILNRLERSRTIQISLGAIPRWSSFKNSKLGLKNKILFSDINFIFCVWIVPILAKFLIQ